MTDEQIEILENLQEDLESRFEQACQRWSDPYQAVAALAATDEAIHRAVLHASTGRDAWMGMMPLEAKRLLRVVGRIVY